MTYHIWRCVILPRVESNYGANFSQVKSFFEFTLASGLFVCAWIQDVARLGRVGREKGSEYLPKNHAVAGRRLLVRLLHSGFSECMWLILKTLRHFGRHISFVWFDLNLLQQVLVAVVQISDRKVSWSAFRLQYFEFVIVARKYFLSRP